MPSPLTSSLAVFALALTTASSSAAQTFVFHLRGDQEVPPIASTASGGCMGTLDQGAATFELVCAHDVVGATVMHVHRGAAGVNGPIAFDLGDPASPVTATWTGMTPADVAELLAGNLYVNIHTAGRPAGEIRGQILSRTVDLVPFTLDGGQVVPPNGSASTGNCTADLDGPATGLAIDCTHNLPTPDEAHLHGAPAGEVGPIAFTFPDPASPLSAFVPMTPLMVAEFAATFLYVDVHRAATGESEAEGGDEIRGQIGTPPAGPTTGTIRVAKRTVPAGGTGFAFTADVPGGPPAFVLSDGGVQVFADVPGGTYTITEEDPAAGGYNVSDVACDDGDSSGDPFARSATVQLQPGEIVTCTFTNLAASGAGELFVFHLSGDQEAPPVATSERGGCAARLEDDALTILCTHDVLGPSVMHIHRGAPGINGPIVFDLGDPASPVQAHWTGLTPADVADLAAGNLYVNIHTSGRPAGAIRGQILPRTVDAGTFPLQGAQVVPPTTSTADGNCTGDLDDAGAVLDLQCAHGLVGVAAAHLHVAPVGVIGPPVLSFDGTSPFAVEVPMTMRLLADFAAGFLYLDLHSDEAPEGGLRGQVLYGVSSPALDIPALGAWGALLLGLALAALAMRRLAGHGR